MFSKLKCALNVISHTVLLLFVRYFIFSIFPKFPVKQPQIPESQPPLGYRIFCLSKDPRDWFSKIFRDFLLQIQATVETEINRNCVRETR
jgi:hypothetical protein